MQSKIKAVLAVILAVFMVSNSYAVGSSGFSTQFAGAKALGQGNAFAGQADDPTALYYNPAGITQLKGSQVSVGAAGILAMTDRTGAGVPDDEMKRQVGVLPNFYATTSAPFGQEKLAVGVGVNMPYGLTTDWAPTSSVRYVTTLSKFEMVNVNPTVAYQVNPQFSMAVGADYVNLFNTTSQAQTNLAAANLDTSPDGSSKLSGNGDGWGYNLGALYKPAEKHSFGISYRSQVKIPIKGNMELTNLSASTQANYNFAGDRYETDANSSFTLPQSVLVGYACHLNEKWTVLADYEWTQWNVFQSQDIALNETDPTRLTFLTGDPGSNVTSVARKWHNTSAFGLGANYKMSDAWQWRGGYAFYQKTVPNDTFSPDVPDASNHLLSAGLSRTWDSLILDFAFNAYIYTNRTVSNEVGGGTVNGTYKTFAPALALNLTYRFGRGQ